MAVRSGVRPCHFPGQPDERAGHRHVGGSGARLVERFRNLDERTPQFDAKDDGVAIGGLEPLERGFVPLQRFQANGSFQWRRIN